MNRRFLLIGLASLAALPATTARADFADDLVAALRKEGYESIELSQTFLGRTRILATAPWGIRELILNPRTGEILRDVFTDPQGNVLPLAGVQSLGKPADDDGGGDDNSGPGGSGDDSDDDSSGSDGEEDDHSGDGEDKSGHGG